VVGSWGVIVTGIKPPLLRKFLQSLTAKDNEKQHGVANWGKKKKKGGVGLHRKFNSFLCV